MPDSKEEITISIVDKLGSKRDVKVKDVEDPATKAEFLLLLSSTKLSFGKIIKKLVK
jgi:hypothetical protein